MSKTSKDLFISQSAVSQTIKELEDELGMPLFERMYRKLYLTENGILFKEYAKRIINLYDDMNEHMKSKKKNILIRIGGSSTIGLYIFPRLCKNFSDQNENIKFNICIDNTQRIIKKVLDNEIDLAVVEGNVISNKELLIHEIRGDKLKLITPNNEKFSSKKNISIKDLENELIIMRERGSGTREAVEIYLDEYNIKGKEQLVTGSTEAIKKMVEIGFGVSILSELTCNSEIKNEKLLQFELPERELFRKFYIVFHKDKYISPPLENFMSMLKSHKYI